MRKNVVLKSMLELKSNFGTLKRATAKGKELGSFNDTQESNVEINRAETININLKQFIENTHEVLAVSENPGDLKFYLALFEQNVEPVSRTLQKQIDDFKSEDFKEIQHELEAVGAHSDNMQNHLITSSIVAFISSLILAVLLALNITRSKIEQAVHLS